MSDHVKADCQRNVPDGGHDYAVRELLYFALLFSLSSCRVQRYGVQVVKRETRQCLVSTACEPHTTFKSFNRIAQFKNVSMYLFYSSIVLACIKIEHVIDPYLLHKFRNVRNQYHSPFVVIERRSDHRNVTKIDVIGRLIENE